MLNNLFILSATGEVLIEKQWVGKMKRAVCETFWEYASKCKDKSQLSPILVTPKYYMIHIQRFDLTFLTCIQKETSPLLLLELQHRIADILIDYFGSPLTETSIRENFSIVYQVLDEMVDGGFAATTEPNQLKEMIVPPSLAKRMLQNLLVTEFAVKSELPSGAVSKIPWRKSDVKYVTNEIYFDLVEQIDAILDVNNNVINCTVNGEIRCNCRLSGTPDLTLTFNRPNALDDASLHRCIRINRYQRERVISFVPPDGNFKLLSYKIPGNTQIPIQIKPVISYRNGQGRVQITVTPKFTGDKPIMNCQIILPLPAVTRSTSLSTNVGTVKIDTITQLCTWVIGKVPRDRTPVLEGNISLPVDWVPDEAPTIRADFQVKMFCTSGLKVDGLAIRGVKYKPFKGVRTITQAGKFQVRCE